jgi:hypothetical protein
LDFPSFALELSVIEALRYKRQGDLASNLSDALSWIAGNIQTARLVDPANSNNIISDDLTPQEKKRIADGAQYARSRPNYSDFVR